MHLIIKEGAKRVMCAGRDCWRYWEVRMNRGSLSFLQSQFSSWPDSTRVSSCSVDKDIAEWLFALPPRTSIGWVWVFQHEALSPFSW